MFDERDNHQWEGGLGLVVVCSSDRVGFRNSRLELNGNTARRPSPEGWFSSSEDGKDTFMNNSVDTGITLHLYQYSSDRFRVNCKSTCSSLTNGNSSLRSNLLIRDANLSRALSELKFSL